MFRRLEDKCYMSIDELPAKRWFNISQNGDITNVLKTPKKVSDKVKIKLYDFYMEMREDHKNRFGLPESYLEEFRLKEEIYDMQLDYIKNNKRYLLGHISLKKEELKVLQAKGDTDFNLDIVTARLSSKVGFGLNINTLTVAQYFGYIKSLG